MASKKKALLKNTLIIALGKISTRFVSLVLLPLYTVYLSPGEFGTLDLVLTYAYLVVPVVTIQMEMASFRFLVDARNDDLVAKKVISNAIWTVSAIAGICVVLAFVLNLFVEINYLSSIVLFAVSMLFSNLFLQFARGFGKNKSFSIASIITGIVTLILVLVFVLFAGLGFEGVLLSMAIANILCSIFLFISLKLFKYVSFAHRDADLRKQMISYSLPLVPNGVSWWIVNVSDRTIISVILGVAANGIYAASNKFAMIFSGFYEIFNLSWTESASIHIDDKDRDSFFSETSNASIKFFGSLGLGLISVVSLLFPLLIADQYRDAYMYIPILIIGAFLNSIVGIYSAIYVAKKLTKKVASTSMVAAVINIVLNIVFINLIGIYAAAISTVLAYLAMAIYRHHDIKKYVKISYDRGVFIVLGLFYVLSMTLYYVNNIYLNILNILICSMAFVFLNKSAVKVIKNKIVSYVPSRKKIS